MKTKLTFTFTEDQHDREWLNLLNNADGLHFTIDSILTWIRQKEKAELTDDQYELLQQLRMHLNDELERYGVMYPILT